MFCFSFNKPTSVISVIGNLNWHSQFSTNLFAFLLTTFSFSSFQLFVSFFNLTWTIELWTLTDFPLTVATNHACYSDSTEGNHSCAINRDTRDTIWFLSSSCIYPVRLTAQIVDFIILALSASVNFTYLNLHSVSQRTVARNLRTHFSRTLLSSSTEKTTSDFSKSIFGVQIAQIVGKNFIYLIHFNPFLHEQHKSLPHGSRPCTEDTSKEQW